jgi:UDP-sugar transporter A1/2/3
MFPIVEKLIVQGIPNMIAGFVIVSALVVTALLQFIFEGKPPSLYCLVALPLVLCSISMYQKYPYQVKKKES